MLSILLPILALLSLRIHRVQAQYTPISVGPLLECGITTFACSGTNGCCTIDGCCGAGCCANGYKCINEGTSDEACCDAFDPTLCGTVATVSIQARNACR